MNNNLGTPFSGTFVTTPHTSYTALTSGAATVTTVGVATFVIHGKFYTRNALAQILGTVDGNGVAFPPLLANQAACVVLAYDTAVTTSTACKTFMGTPVTLDSGGSFTTGRPEFPVVSDNVCPFAYIIVKNGATGSSWTLGTGLWNATGITNVGPISIAMIPGRPQVS